MDPRKPRDLELIPPDQLLGSAEQREGEEGTTDTARMPRVLRMPEGIEVVEERLGRATAQWILEVRCDCGRRWFELEEVETARCPRCETLVRITIE